MKIFRILFLIATFAVAQLAKCATPIVEPSTDDETHWYFITSYPTGDATYARLGVIYNTRATEGGKLRWAEKSLDENALWKFVDSGDGTYYIVNKATGYYMSAESESGTVGNAYAKASKDAASLFQVAKQTGKRTCTITQVGGNAIAVQYSGGFVVTLDEASAAGATTWYLIAAKDAEVATAEENAKSDKADYQLVWEEEFNEGTVPNDKDWNYESGFVRNYENQWYQSDNASIEDGNLVIEGRKEHRDNPTYVEGSSDWKTSRQYIEYTSTSMTTLGKHAFTYGRLEVKAQIPTGTGSWPAIWLLGYETSGDFHWPHSGEIDVLEYYNERTWANFCWGANGIWSDKWNSRYTPMDHWRNADSDWDSAYHTWRMDWSEESIKLYLDDELINVSNLDNTVNSYGSVSGTNPFRDHPMYVLLNLAMGGSNGGTIEDSRLPLRYKVDYVRIFQKPGQWYEEYGQKMQTGITNAASSDVAAPIVRFVSNGRWAVDATTFSDDATARIFDVSGKCVAEQCVSGSYTELHSLAQMQPGVYTVLVSDNENGITAKILK